MALRQRKKYNPKVIERNYFLAKKRTERRAFLSLEFFQRMLKKMQPAKRRPIRRRRSKRNDLIAYLHYKKIGEMLHEQRKTEKVRKANRGNRIGNVVVHGLRGTLFDIVRSSKRHHPSLQTTVALLIVTALVFSNFTSFLDNSSVPRAQAASLTFVQTDWSGNASTTQYGVHPTNQTGWTNYNSKDANVSVATSGQINLAATASSTTHTTDTDWNAGTLSTTTVSGTGSGSSVKISTLVGNSGAAACSGTDHAGADLVFTSTGNIATGDHCNVAGFVIESGVTVTPSSSAVVRIFAATSTIDGTFNFNAKGSIGGWNGGNGSGSGKGIGCSGCGGSGAGYGGAGGDSGGGRTGGSTHGSSTAPTALGSGGGGSSWLEGIGGTGGGALYLQVTGTFTLSGPITTNGNNGVSFSQQYGTGAGGGSGGSIWIDVGTFAGSGNITANGGNGGSSAHNNPATDGGGGGGGGRIAIYYTTTTHSGSVTSSAGSGGGSSSSGDDGVVGSAGTVQQTESGYSTSGTLESASINLEREVTSFTTISWTETLPASTNITLQMATSTDGAAFGSFVGPDGTTGSSFTTNTGENIHSSFNESQYFKYKATLTGTATSTPILSDVAINYEYYATSTSQTLTFSYYDSSSSSNILSSIAWSETLGYGGDIKFQVRTAPDSSGSPGTATSFCGPSDASTTACTTSTYFTAPAGSETVDNIQTDGASDQWVQLQLTLSTTSSTSTPTLADLTLTYAVNSAPNFNPTFNATEGATASQNSTTSVSISYSVRDTDGDTGTITPEVISPTFEYSLNGGSSWTSIASTTLAVGDAYNKTVETSSYRIYEATWAAESTLANTYSTTTQIRVTANDNESANNTVATTTANFILDTVEPTLGTPTGGGTGVNANQNTTTTLGNDKIASTSVTLQLSSADDQALQMKISNTSDCSSGTYESYASTKAHTLASTDGTKNVSVQFRDVAGNVSTCASDTITLDTTAPAVPANMAIQEISNSNTSDDRLFVSWGTITDSGDFVDYRLYRSTNGGTTYALLSTITTRTTNFYIDSSVTSGTTYHYLVNARDDVVNISASSTAVNMAPGSNPTDSIAPTISARATSTIQTTNIAVTWTTNEVADSTVLYSTDNSLSNIQGTTGFVTSHSVTLRGLTANTTYNYQIRSIDPSSNTATSTTGTFTTAVADSVGPTISNIATSTISETQGTVTWTTNEVADSYVVYSTTSGFTTGNVVGITNATTSHSVTLQALTAATTYYFHARSTDPANNTATSSQQQFTTSASSADVTVPTITSVATSSVAYNTATVTWTTNEAASSFVEFGKATSYGRIAGQYDATTTHSVSLPQDLTFNTQYNFRVRSQDAAGNEALSSNNTFTTSADPSDTTAPTISNVVSATSTQTSITITWTTNEVADSFIGYSPTTTIYNIEQGAPAMKISHSVTLVGLTPNTLYFYRVISTDPSGNKKIDNNSGTGYTFATASSASDPPVISALQVQDVSKNQATIAWDTDKAADSFVEYGLDTGYGRTYGLLNSVTAHSITLPADLLSQATYHFRVRSTDSDKNETVSNDQSFTTETAGDITPPVITSVATSSISLAGATVTWTTNENADNIVSYGTATTSLSSVAGSNASSTTSHTVEIAGLSSGTKYYFQVRSKDSAGNITTDTNSGSYYSFTTTADTTGPEISNVSATSTATGATSIVWTTNENSTSQVEYGLTVSLGVQTAQDSTLTIQHSATLSELNSNTTYYYQVISQDTAGNPTTDNNSGSYYSFTTAQISGGSTRFIERDTTPPVIRAVSAKDIEQTRATIIWKTDGFTNSLVSYGTTKQYNFTSGTLEVAGRDHSVLLDNLSEDTAYNYKVTSRDSAGNARHSENFTFKTLPRAEEEPVEEEPIAEELLPEVEEEAVVEEPAEPVEEAEPPVVEEVEGFSEVILEKIENAARVAREGIEKAKEGAKSESEKRRVVARTVEKIIEGEDEETKIEVSKQTIKDLSEASVLMVFANGFSRLVESFSFEQLSASLEQAARNIVSAPQIAGDFPQAKDITSSSAIVVWLTDKLSNSIVALSSAEDYDPSKEDPYTIQLGDPDERVNSHIVEITGLDSNTLYHFQARSQADIGARGLSEDRIFITKSELPQITDLVITEITEHTATLKWSTNVSTDTTIEYTNIQTGETFTQGEPTLLRAHSFTLKDLEFNNTYRLRIRARDEFNSESITSLITFSTSTDDTPPKISHVRSETAISPQGTRVQAIITWKTDEPATTQLFYQKGLEDKGTVQLSKTSKDINPITNHIVVVTAFKPASVYKFYVQSEDQAGNLSRSKNFTILTPRYQQTVVQIILKNFGETFGFLQRLRL